MPVVVVVLSKLFVAIYLSTDRALVESRVACFAHFVTAEGQVQVVHPDDTQAHGAFDVATQLVHHLRVLLDEMRW